MFTTFYHGMTKKLTASFGTLFNNIYIERGSGDTYKKIKIPLTYAPKEKMMERIGLELDDPGAYAVQTTLPRMSFMMTGLEYDTERKRNSSSRRMAEKILDEHIDKVKNDPTYESPKSEIGDAIDDFVTKIVETSKEEEYNPYCPICDSCGEDGCCSATSCQQHPEGKYCKTYLNDLNFGYIMYHKLMKLIDGDEKYDAEVDKMWDETYDKVFKVE